VSDHTLSVSNQYVGTIDLGFVSSAVVPSLLTLSSAFLARVNVTADLGSFMTANRGAVVVDEQGKVAYVSVSATVGQLPDVAAIKKTLGL
jgi:peroxiredoxin